MQNDALINTIKRWRMACLYVVIIFITTPLLPSVVEFVARCLGLSLKELLIYLKVIILTGLACALPLYLYLTGRHKEKTCWGVLFLVGVTVSLLVGNMGSPVDATHLLEYGGLSIVIFYTLAKDKEKPFLRSLYYQAALITLVVGVVDEVYQGYLPNRYYDFNDIVTNTVSGVLGLFFLWGIVERNTHIGD